jgi:hypothetical protein
MLKKLYWIGVLWLSKVVAASAGDWQQANYIVDSFFEIALKSEYATGAQSIRKWPATGIRYYYVHHVADDRLHETLTERHLRHLQAITGLPIKPAKTLQEANLIIVFSHDSSLKNDLQQFFDMQSAKDLDYFFRNSVCLGHFSTDSAQAIQKATVIIPVDRARRRGKLVDCVVEELTQTLGLPNDSTKVFPSIFNDRSIDHLLSGLDYVLLKILYDARLRAGMNQAKARPIVQIIVAEFIQKGIVAHADKQVQNGSLYSLMNGASALP